jgi:hypothetical protein
MPGLIQRVPTGFVDLLGLKSTGQNPTISPDELANVIDVFDLYKAARWEVLSGQTNAVNLVGFWGVTQWTVPAGELWLVDQMATSSVALPAATTYNLRQAIIAPNVSAPIAISPGSSQPVAVAESACLGWGPLVMQSGQQGGIYVQGLTLGTAQTFTVRGRVLRLTV